MAALGNQDIIFRPSDPECAPKSHALRSIKPALDHKSIPKFGCAPIIYLRANDDRVPLRLSHFREGQTEFFGKQCARDFDEAQICDVRHNPTAIGVKKHHPQFCADTRPASIHCPEVTTKITKDTKLN